MLNKQRSDGNVRLSSRTHSILHTSPNLLKTGAYSIYDLVEAVLRFFLNRITDLSYKLIRDLRFMRAHMIDVEHRTVWFISVCIEPLNNCRIDFRDQCIAALVSTARNRNLRQCAEFHVICVGVAVLSQILCKL